jgi:ankyrin repeat protein
MQALYDGDRERAELLLAEDCDVFEAAAFGRVARLREAVIRDRAAANARAPDDFTPLHLAAFFGHPEATHLLLDAGAAVGAEATNSFLVRVAPLHSAVAGGDRESCQLLLEAGADVNAAQGDGFTPLMAAVQSGDVELVKILLAAGADTSVAGADGTTAASLAQKSGHEDVAALLEPRAEA